VLYSGSPEGLRAVEASKTAHYLFGEQALPARRRRVPVNWLKLQAVTLNNLHQLSVDFPIGAFTASRVCQVPANHPSSARRSSSWWPRRWGMSHRRPRRARKSALTSKRRFPGSPPATLRREWNSSSAWSTSIRNRSAARHAPTWQPIRGCSTMCAGCLQRHRQRSRRYDAGRFSFNIPKGRCATCEGEGFVSVELLFMPSVYAPCPTCHGARYNDDTLKSPTAARTSRPYWA